MCQRVPHPPPSQTQWWTALTLSRDVSTHTHMDTNTVNRWVLPCIRVNESKCYTAVLQVSAMNEHRLKNINDCVHSSRIQLSDLFQSPVTMVTFTPFCYEKPHWVTILAASFFESMCCYSVQCKQNHTELNKLQYVGFQLLTQEYMKVV